MPNKNIYYADGKQIKSIDLPQYPDAAWDWITGGPDSPKDNELFAKVAAVYRAANMAAEAVAGMPFAIVKGETDHDTSDAWENKVGFMPNPRELLRLWRMSLFFTNSAYGFMEGNRVIKSMRYIVPTTMTPVVDPVNGLTGFKRTLGSTTTQYTLKDRRIFYMWRLDHTTELLPSPNTEFKALMSAAGILYYSDYFVQSFFQRGGIKPTLLMVKGVSNETEKAKLESIWDKIIHGWYKYTGKVFNAEALEAHQVGEGIENFKDNQIHDEKLADIAMAAGMPLSLLLANSANYATAQMEYVTWFRDSVSPWAEFMAGAMNDQLFTSMGLRFEFRPEMTDPGQEDEVSRAGAYQAYVNAGMLPSIAAQVVGIELPKGVKYKDLDPDEEEVEEVPEELQPFQEGEETTDEEEEEEEPVAKFTPSLDQLQEMNIWQQIARRKMKRNESMSFPFTCKQLPEDIAQDISARLERATDEDGIKAAFCCETMTPMPQVKAEDYAIDMPIAELTEAVNRMTEAMKITEGEHVAAADDGQAATMSAGT